MEKNRDTKKKKLTLNYYPKIDARHKFSSLRQQEASFVNKILKKVYFNNESCFIENYFCINTIIK